MTEFYSQYKRPRPEEGGDPDAVAITTRTFNGDDSGHNKALVAMWRTGRFCDACVVIGERKFDVHSVVLAISSTFFARAFDGGFSESIDRTVHLELPGGAEAWEPIAEFMYTGRCVLDVGSLLPLLEAAHYLQMEVLVAHLSDAAAARITPPTFGDAWETAGRLSLPKFECLLATSAAGCVDNIVAFACSPSYASLPEAVLTRISQSTSLRQKSIRITMARDGSLSTQKLSRVQEAFEVLGGGMEEVRFTIDKQARVSLSWVAKPETCGGGQHFELDFNSLIRTLRPTWKLTLKYECCYHPKIGGTHNLFSSPSPAHYDFSRDEIFIVDRLQISEGFPKTVRASPDGPPLSHYKLIVDVGMSFETACAKLANLLARSRRPAIPGEGFYCSDAPPRGQENRSYSLLLSLLHADTFSVYTPEGLMRQTTKAAHERENTLVPVEEVGDGWTTAYDRALTTCVHGASCGQGVSSAHAEESRRKASRIQKAEASETAADRPICTKGRRLRFIHLLTGAGLVPLWAQLVPNAIMHVHTSSQPPVEFSGVWVDPSIVPKY